MKFDDVYLYIGGYDLYQQLLVHFVNFVNITHTFSNIGTVFLNGFMKHYCTVPDIGNCTSTDYECGLANLSLPPDDESTPFINETTCRMYVRDPDNGTEITHCQHGWTYDKSQYESTIVSEFDLVCEDSYKVSLAASAYLLGFFIGSILFGTISDYIGRKRGMMITFLLRTLTGVVQSMAPSYWVYFVFRVMNGACTIGSYIATFVYVNEMIEPSKRAMVSAISFLYWCVGFFVLSLIAYFLREWRIFFLVCSLCPVPLFFVYFFIPESPRWLLLRNKTKEAKRILEKIAEVNKRELPDDVIDRLAVGLQKESGQETTQHKISQRASIVNVFRYPNMRKKTLILVYSWFTVSLVYYGLMYGVEGLDVNIYLGVLISGVIQTMSIIGSLYCVQKLGRRNTLGALLISAGAMCFINVWIPTHLGGLRTGISMTGQFFTFATFYVVYIYSSELYSTDVRSFGVGLCSFTARISGMLAPQILFLQKLWIPLPLVTFSVTSVSAGILTFLLPETLNFALPQTIEEAELVTRNTNRWKTKTNIELTVHEGKT